MKNKCLSIAGFDGSGGAGIQADLKTFSALNCYGMNVLTSLPVQNTMGVRKCFNIEPACINEQLEAIFDDIIPDAIKIGMLFSSEIITIVSNFLRKQAQNIPIVLDPVMVAKSGDLLLQNDAIEALKFELIPLVTIITPNIPEAQTLIPNVNCKQELAEAILKLGCKTVLVKGGHETGPYSSDLLLDNQGKSYLLRAERILSKNTHGTGCTLSAAITSFLAQDLDLFESCKLAKQYLFEAIEAAKDQSLGKGCGPVHHFYNLWNEDFINGLKTRSHSLIT